MAKTKQGIIENCGVSQRDLERGFIQVAEQDERSSYVLPENQYIGGPIDEQPMKGFLGRAKGWER